MINKLKHLINTEEKKRLLSNFFSLFSLQVANYIFPLITFPYLVRILGVEKFGLLAFAGATIAYFMILTDYGFNLTATREISIYRHHKEKIEEIFSSVLIIKTGLSILSFLILIGLILFFDKFRKDYLVFIFTFGTVIGQVLFPQWFFQGMERMKYITVLNVTAKAIFTVAIFVFIHKSSDYIYVPLLNSVGFIVAGILGLWIVFRDFNIKFKWQKLEVLKEYFIEGWHIFISRVAVNLYSSTNLLILGFITNNIFVGYYAIADKLINAISSIGRVFTATIFPYLARKWKEDRKNYYKFFYKFLRILIFMMALLALVIFIFSTEIIEIIAGKNITISVIILKILSINILFYPLGSIFTENLITQNKNYYVTKITAYTAAINLMLVFPFIYLWNVYGLAILSIIVQIFQVIINSKYFFILKRQFKCVE